MMAAGAQQRGLTRAIVASFKSRGLSLKTDAMRLLTASLESVPDYEISESLDTILTALEKESLSSNIIEHDDLERVIAALVRASEEGEDPSAATLRHFSVISAFDVPNLVYSVDRKTFFPAGASSGTALGAGAQTPGAQCTHAAADAKTAMFRERYALLRQRILRNPLFKSPVVGGVDSSDYYKLTPIESLVGFSDAAESTCVFGMLAQLEEGRYFIEDPNGSVPIDLSEAVPATGLFTENCFVLAEGTFVDGVFKARVIGFPPPESREQAKAYFSNVNFFGGEPVAHDDARLVELEAATEDAMFVVLSDVHLDRPKTLERLRLLFTGYASIVPHAFVLIGNFLAEPHGPGQYKALQEGFEALADIIGSFDDIAQRSHFVIVPGPLDVGPGNILPRPPMPDMLTKALAEKVANVHFASNPCRIRYCTQEIVICREDILNKMRRNCVLKPSEAELDDVSKHLVKTLLDQAHLCPLPLHVRPLYWAYDAALRLYPLPTVVILADKYEPYSVHYEGCLCFNPGSFPSSDFSFMVYWPSRREAEFSKVE